MMLGFGAASSSAPPAPPPTTSVPPAGMPHPPFTPGPLRFHRNVFGPWVFGGPFEERVVYMPDYYDQFPPWIVPVLIGLVVILAVRK